MTALVYVLLAVGAIVSDVATGSSNLTVALALGATLVLLILAIEKSGPR